MAPSSVLGCHLVPRAGTAASPSRAGLHSLSNEHLAGLAGRKEGSSWSPPLVELEMEPGPGERPDKEPGAKEQQGDRRVGQQGSLRPSTVGFGL